MKLGSVRVASWNGISPMEPLTSSANTMPTELGWSALSRLSRKRTPCGLIDGLPARAKTASCASDLRASSSAWCAARL